MRALWFILAVLLTRFARRPGFLYDLDSVNFALALHQYDIEVHQPHPPGYFLYVMLGRAFYAVTRDELSAYFGLSVAASLAAGWCTAKLAEDWAGRSAGNWTLAWFVFSPLVWFHGAEPLTYIVEMAFAAGVGWMAWRSLAGDSRAVLWMAMLLGTAIGFRQSSSLFLGPLVLYVLWRRTWKERLAGAGVFLVSVLAWWFPMIAVSGGWDRYVAVLSAIWSTGGGASPFWSQPEMVLPRTLGTMLALFFVSGMALWPYLTTRGLQATVPARFAWIWVLPGLAFLCLMFFKTVNSGYVLGLAPPWLAAIGVAWSAWKMPERKRLLRAGMIAMLNVVFLAASPFYFSWKEAGKVEQELRAVCACVERNFAPETSVLIGIDTHFLGFRHAGWNLPRYRVLSYPGLKANGREYVSVMEQRRTRRAYALPAGADRYVLFPLPATEEYRESWAGFVRLWPAEGRQEVSCGGVKLVSGPAAHLRALYPRLPDALEGQPGAQ